ncbi:MAG: polyprenyl synthetase family protein [Thermodesulfobacteriota bacterium]
MPTPLSPSDQQNLFASLGLEAAAIDQRIREDIDRIASPDLAAILGHLLLAGGKRIRPALTLFTADLVTGAATRDRGRYDLAIPLEYLHAASLLHDDVIDGAAQRRGRATANTVWGNSRVILAGDYLHARAFAMAGAAGGRGCMAAIGQATAAMVEAEFLQMDVAGGKAAADTETYFAVVRGKTGALIQAACEVGALAGGATEEQCRRLATYGANLGVCFQIVDDLLDYQGDPAATGKAVGNDFLEGKLTLPVLYALQDGGAGEAARIRQLLSRRDPGDFAEMKELVAGGLARARETAAALTGEAVAALAGFPECRARSLLTALAGYVLDRNK